VKLYIRLLLTIPFVLVTFVFYKLSNPDAVCNGPLTAIIMVVVYGSLLLIGIFAAVAAFRKKQFDKPTPEPITLTISLITLLFIIYDMTFRGHTNGDIWIEAENKNLSDWQESKWLTLRKNGNFTFSPNADCGFSGKFKKIGDTIILDKDIIHTNEISSVYLLKVDKLVPLFDHSH
jgi:hypothetical protein